MARPRQQRHLTTLAALVAGIVGARACHLGKIAQKIPAFGKAESRIKRFHRFLKNPRLRQETYFLPLAQVLVARLAERQPLLLVFDATQLGRGQVALVASVLYGRRALPVAWLLKRSRGTQFTQKQHRRLVEALRPIIPAEADVIFLGDGEFDGPELLADLEAQGWAYVCRTSKRSLIDDGHACYAVGELTPAPGHAHLTVSSVAFTEAGYGPVQVIAWHEAHYAEAIYLVTNLDVGGEACHWYGHRSQVETLFSDQKSRGFGLERSHVASPDRLSHLLMAAALAYIWMVYLGVEAHRRGWVRLIHRSDRCDWGLFQVGLSLLEHCLNEGWPLMVSFRLPRSAPVQSVR